MKHVTKNLLLLLLMVGLLIPCLAACWGTTTPTTPPDDPNNDVNIGDDIIVGPAAEVVINELCADNKGSLAVSGKTEDWIELYNTSDVVADISGWSLSDDRNNPRAYTFPAGTTIEPHGYLVVMAVDPAEVGQWANVKPAAPFKLAEDGEGLIFVDKDGYLREEVDFPAIHSKDIEITYSRINDGAEEWGEANPTPAATNNGATRMLATSTMQFSHESGFYDKEFYLDINIPQGYTLYYTTDCTDPRAQTSSPQENTYSKTTLQIYDKSSEPDTFSGIKVTGKNGYQFIPGEPVDKCFVLRAYVESPEGHRSRTITKTYFIGFDEKDGYTDIPIVTLTSDPMDLYGDATTKGLFVADSWGNNVNRQEIAADMTYMNADGEFIFSQKVGIRIRGTSTRGAHQKNLNVFARSRYDGNAAFQDPLFEGVKETRSFVLRSDGMDRRLAGQGFLQDLVAHREVSAQKYYPAVVFLDGEYYGIYNLYERFDDDFAEAHYGVKSSDVWIVKKGGSKSSMDANCVAAGNDYTNLMHFICNVGQNNDMSNAATYKKLTEWVDMQSLCDLIATQLYIGNEDFAIAQNIAAWRTATVDPTNPYADGRWRFVIYDLDITLDCSYTGVHYDYKYNPFTQPQPWAGAGFLNWGYNWDKKTPFTQNLMKSPDFVKMFSETFIEIATVDFAVERVDAEIDRCIERLLPNMEQYISRYHNWYKDGAETLREDFYDDMKDDREYLHQRAAYVVPYMQSAMGLPADPLPTAGGERGKNEI